MTPTDLCTDEYGAFCFAVRDLCAIDLTQYKRRQMERRVRTFAQRRGITRLDEYAGMLGGAPEELRAFLDHMTINVSQLWRNPEQWKLLESRILPAFAGRPRFNAWSAGCSYGAEAYTLAAICAQVLPGVRTAIVGTDIDGRMIQSARAGVFSEADARDVPPTQRRRWFAERDGLLHADAELTALCRFEVADLLAMRARHGVYDLVLCRNTVIYFTADVRDALHARLAKALMLGGHLMVGSTERVRDPGALGLEIAHPFVYRRVA